MYNHSKQYRCTIIRGKAQSEIDNLLPAYAKVIDEICPCETASFEERFNSAFARFLPSSSRIKKTFDNHRTEISGALFGMYYESSDGFVYESERTAKYLSDNDQPAFFKDVCFKLQFPNGMDSTHTTRERIESNISVRPACFLINVLLLAKEKNIHLTKKEIAYYILNSLDVLQGNATSEEVLQQIQDDRENHINRDIIVPGKASSYTHQHINEQLNYLELANLIEIDNEIVFPNMKEYPTLKLFAKEATSKPIFDIYQYDFSNPQEVKAFQFDWDLYFSKTSDIVEQFTTSTDALGTGDTHNNGENTTELGDEGENFVFNYEKKRVGKYNHRLTNKVIALGKQRGLGYDIQSIVAKPGELAEFAKYIEVKSTKRVTAPSVTDSLWIDTINITRNEWIASQQHGSFYSIYRVYFTKKGIVLFILDNIAKKNADGLIQVTPMTYRIDFSGTSIDEFKSLSSEEVAEYV